MLKNSILRLFLLIFTVSVTATALAAGPGDKASDFTITNYDGTKYNLNEALSSSKNGVILIFWSLECPFVQPYNDRINDYAKEYTDNGFTLWAMNSNNTEPKDKVAEYVKEKGLTFPMLKDENNVVADLFGATRTPEVFIIGKDGVIKYHGRISDNKDKAAQTTHDLGNAADEIAAGKEVSVKETKSFGCGIKRNETK
jgi:peroxiredoxin